MSSVPFWPTWKYIRLHIPSGTRTQGEHAARRHDFLQLLATWNAQQPGTWQYWEGELLPTDRSG